MEASPLRRFPPAASLSLDEWAVAGPVGFAKADDAPGPWTMDDDEAAATDPLRHPGPHRSALTSVTISVISAHTPDRALPPPEELEQPSATLSRSTPLRRAQPAARAISPTGMGRVGPITIAEVGALAAAASSASVMARLHRLLVPFHHFMQSMDTEACIVISCGFDTVNGLVQLVTVTARGHLGSACRLVVGMYCPVTLENLCREIQLDALAKVPHPLFVAAARRANRARRAIEKSRSTSGSLTWLFRPLPGDEDPVVSLSVPAAEATSIVGAGRVQSKSKGPQILIVVDVSVPADKLVAMDRKVRGTPRLVETPEGDVIVNVVSGARRDKSGGGARRIVSEAIRGGQDKQWRPAFVVDRFDFGQNQSVTTPSTLSALLRQGHPSLCRALHAWLCLRPGVRVSVSDYRALQESVLEARPAAMIEAEFDSTMLHSESSLLTEGPVDASTQTPAWQEAVAKERPTEAERDQLAAKVEELEELLSKAMATRAVTSRCDKIRVAEESIQPLDEGSSEGGGSARERSAPSPGTASHFDEGASESMAESRPSSAHLLSPMSD
jgi:hypothetical protein